MCMCVHAYKCVFVCRCCTSSWWCPCRVKVSVPLELALQTTIAWFNLLLGTKLGPSAIVVSAVMILYVFGSENMLNNYLRYIYLSIVISRKISVYIILSFTFIYKWHINFTVCMFDTLGQRSPLHYTMDHL